MTRRIFTLFVSLVATISFVYAQCPSDEIWYTTTDGKKLDLGEYDDGVLWNTYYNGKGIIKLDGNLWGLGVYNSGDHQVNFEYCKNLKTITLPNNSDITIGYHTPNPFVGCHNLSQIKWAKATKDGRCLIIDGYLYSFATAGLTSYSIPNSVKIIDERAFYGCSNLTSVTIPSSVTQIRYGAFDGCSGLTSITIPNSVKEISDDAFAGCSSLKSFKGKFASKDGRCLIINGKLIAFAPADITEYTIPDGITEIGSYAFSNCSGITSLTIPNSVTKIEKLAFSNCKNLSSITIPESVTEIGWGAFKDCGSLSNIIIPEGVTKIQTETFSGCRNMNSITIPDSVTEIDENAFKVRYIKSVTINTITGNRAYIESVFGRDKIVAYTGKYASEDGFCLIKDGTLIHFAGKGQTEYTIPKGITKIGYNAFKGCSSLTDVTIPDSVTTIQNGAFEGCSSLTSITIPNSVVELDGRTFLECSSLTKITIPNSITEIGFRTFEKCSSLTSITIPDNITKIQGNAFEGCCNIQSITINTITGDISTIKEVFGTEKIEAFTGKYASNDGLCLIKDGILNEFVGKKLTEYTIPEGVTKIGDDVFKECYNLTNIILPQSLTEISETAFLECCNLTSIAIPESVTSIDNSAFSDCNSLTSITIPDGVTKIKEHTFAGCSSLADVTIGSGITEIEKAAFDGCNITKLVCFANTPPTIYDIQLSEETVIYVPKKSVKLYKEAAVWSKYKKQIKAYKEAK